MAVDEEVAGGVLGALCESGAWGKAVAVVEALSGAAGVGGRNLLNACTC